MMNEKGYLLIKKKKKKKVFLNLLASTVSNKFLAPTTTKIQKPWALPDNYAAFPHLSFFSFFPSSLFYFLFLFFY
jgi:hypothetical protein